MTLQEERDELRAEVERLNALIKGCVIHSAQEFSEMIDDKIRLKSQIALLKSGFDGLKKLTSALEIEREILTGKLYLANKEVEQLRKSDVLPPTIRPYDRKKIRKPHGPACICGACMGFV